jgi:hypothetical protein
MALFGTLLLQVLLPIDPGVPAPVQLVPRRDELKVKPMPTDYPEILQRPIFASDRHPMIEPMAGLSLVGVGIAGSRTMALLQNSDGQVVRSRPGDVAAGWRIASITLDSVFFERQGERRVLKLDVRGRKALAGMHGQAGGK